MDSTASEDITTPVSDGETSIPFDDSQFFTELSNKLQKSASKPQKSARAETCMKPISSLYKCVRSENYTAGLKIELRTIGVDVPFKSYYSSRTIR